MRRPRETLSEILEYLELETPPATIEAMLASLGEPASDVHRTSGAEESIGRWQRDLPDGVKGTAERVLGEALGEFGYAA